MIELVQRAGVNGTGYILLGSKGVPFQMRSWVDCTDESAALTLMAGYRNLIGNDMQTVVFRNVDYNVNQTVQAVVIDVTDDRLETTINITGGLNVSNGSAGVVLNVVWHLVMNTVEP